MTDLRADLERRVVLRTQELEDGLYPREVEGVVEDWLEAIARRKEGAEDAVADAAYVLWQEMEATR